MSCIKIQTNINKNDIVKTACGKCKLTTQHKILADVSLKGKERIRDWNDDLYQWDNEYQIVQCMGCESVSFRYTHMNSEDYREGPDGEPDINVERYPNPEAGRLTIKDISLVPSELQRIYSETLFALNNGQRVLAGIGVRAIVETVCKDKQTKGTLYERINELVSLGVLTHEGSNILHELRILGNEAAHAVTPHSNMQLGLAMDVIDHLLQGVYILPHHAKKTFKAKASDSPSNPT